MLCSTCFTENPDNVTECIECSSPLNILDDTSDGSTEIQSQIKPLSSGENAVNLYNSQKEKPESTAFSATKTRELEFKEEMSTPAKKPKGWAVIVGISQYEYQSWNLEYAHRDAEEFCKILLTQTGEIFEQDRIQVLTNEKATKSNIESALYDFLKKPDKDDLVIIFFACHGSPDPDRPNNVYFIPYDTEPESIASKGILMKVISDIIGPTLISQKVIVFADTCHSGNIGGGMGHRSLKSNELINKYLHDLTKSQSSIALLTSAEATEVAREDQRWGGGHGVFTYYLLEGMKGDADQNKDGIITVGELFEYVREKVKTATDYTQHPAIGIDAFDRNLPIVMRSQTTIKTTSLTTSNENIFIQELPDKIMLEMIKIPQGSFQMGSSNKDFWSEEKPEHQVEIQSFWLGKYLITQEQWRKVAAMDRILRDLNPELSYFQGDKLPVEKVSWYDAMEFCARLSQYTNRKYRLPSEAEWEYACRAGKKTPYCCGMNLTRRYAHFGDSQGSTRSVGSLRANDWSLYDMHGNVWEWCADPWHDDYNNAPQNGGVWDENQPNNEFYENINHNLSQFLKDERWRVMRGGSFGDPADSCRSAFRIDQDPNARGNTLGLRIALIQPYFSR